MVLMDRTTWALTASRQENKFYREIEYTELKYKQCHKNAKRAYKRKSPYSKES